MQDDGMCGEETKNVVSDVRACVASAKELNCTKMWRTSTVCVRGLSHLAGVGVYSACLEEEKSGERSFGTCQGATH